MLPSGGSLAGQPPVALWAATVNKDSLSPKDEQVGLHDIRLFAAPDSGRVPTGLTQ